MVAFAKNFAAQQVALAEEYARAEAAEAESKQLRARLLYAISAIVIMAGLLSVSTAATFFGTNKIVKKYHFTETRGDMLTNEAGETLSCASAEFALGGDGNASTLVSRDGAEIATRSADLETSGGMLADRSGQPLVAVSGLLFLSGVSLLVWRVF